MSLLGWGVKKIFGMESKKESGSSFFSLSSVFKALAVIFTIGALSNVFNNEADDGDGFVQNSLEKSLEFITDIGELAEKGRSALNGEDGPTLS
ncbi:MAG: hypothetical protein CMH26_08210 [Micavibrio sp.]|nr:hypothetical protein [Micavibrio sp.]|tara:strand:+ start:396 stop:674 length:279 start_codon:yes stop_codon:yes gene_type:complete